MWQKRYRKQTDKSLKILRFLCGKKIADFIYVKTGNYGNKNLKNVLTISLTK